MALCQFLPGPASSQVGMAPGLGHAGGRGMLAAWAGFKLPSAAPRIALAEAIVRQPALAIAAALVLAAAAVQSLS